MTANELERYLSAFLIQCRAAKHQHEQAVIAEQSPNDAIQDILHVAEFNPALLDDVPLPTLLHDLRTARRETKKELEVSQIFYNWTEENKKCIDKLDQVLGAIRKVLRRQPNDMYRYKSDVIGEKDSWLQAAELENPNQMKLEDFFDV